MLKQSIRRHVSARTLVTLRAVRALFVLSVLRTVGGFLRYLPGTSKNFGPPRVFCEVLALYIARKGAGSGGVEASYVEVMPSERICRIVPSSIERPLGNDFYAMSDLVATPRGVATIPLGRVLTDSGKVIAPRDCLLGEVSSDFLGGDPRDNKIFLKAKLPRPQFLAGNLAVLTMTWSDNYCHWLFDTLPRFHLIELSGVKWDRIVVPNRTRFQRESLEMLRLGSDRIVAEPGQHLEAECLIVPSLPQVPGNFPPWIAAFLRERFLSDSGIARSQRSKIYISRAKAPSRRLLNEDELFLILEKVGFKRVLLEDLSFREQIDLFHGADLVVAPHGAGLSNLVFCRPGAGVVELFDPNDINACYWSMSSGLGLKYRCVVGEPWQVPSAIRTMQVRGDIFIDVAKVRTAIAEFLSEN